MGSTVTEPPKVEIHYPEGPRVPEGNLQTQQRMELVFTLRRWFAERGDDVGAWVCSDINIYYKQGDPTAVVAPDVAVAFGVDADTQHPQNTYRVWDAGAAPCFALEIASPNTVQVDLHDKPDKYAQLGVAEYWRLDPTGGHLLDPPLQGETRRSGRWTPIKVTPEGRGGLRARSRALGLDLCWQPPKLRLWDLANRAWLPDNHDIDTARAHEAAARKTAEARAANETTARKTAEARASAAEAEIAELRARLRDTHREPGQ
jgi:Uma2 family endonuclease